jgi:dTDP-glucose 4,6-dehydratase
LEVLAKRGKVGESYNIGSNVDLTNIKLTKLILQQMKKKRFKIGKNVKINFVKDRPGHDIRYALSSKKIQKKLRWKAAVNINEGLSKTINWYIDNQKYFKSILKKEYVNRIGLKI